MMTLLRASSLALLAVLLGSAANAQSSYPFEGTWTQDPRGCSKPDTLFSHTEKKSVGLPPTAESGGDRCKITGVTAKNATTFVLGLTCLDEGDAPFTTHSTLVLSGKDAMSETMPETKGNIISYKRCGPAVQQAQAKPKSPFGSWRVRSISGNIEATLPLPSHPTVPYFRMYCGAAAGIALEVPNRTVRWGKRPPILIKGPGINLTLFPNGFDLVSGMAGGQQFLAVMTNLQRTPNKTLIVESQGKSAPIDFDGGAQVVALMRGRCH